MTTQDYPDATPPPHVGPDEAAAKSIRASYAPAGQPIAGLRYDTPALVLGDGRARLIIHGTRDELAALVADLAAQLDQVPSEGRESGSMPPHVRRVLDVSTAHLPPKLGVDGLGDVPGVIADETDRGWLLWVPDDPDESVASEQEPPPQEVIHL